MARFRHRPRLVLWLACVVVALAVAYPIGCLALRCFHPPETGWSLQAWRSLGRSPFLGTAVRNTLLISTASSLLSLVLAGALALLSARTDSAGRGLLRAAALSPLLLSQSVTAIAWIVLAEGRGGLLNVALKRVGAGLSFEILSLPGIVFTTTLLTLPLNFLILEALALNLDAGLEEAAFVCGAGRGAALRRVAAPLLWPGVAAAGLLSFMLSNVMFSVQGLLGVPRHIWTVANLIYYTLGTYPSDLDSASSLAFGVLAVSLSLLWLQAHLLAGRDYHVVTGRSRGRVLWPLSTGERLAALTVAAALFVLTTALPYGALLWRSLAGESVQVFAGPASWLRDLNLDGYRELLADPAMRRGLVHSFVLSAAATVSSLGLAAVLAYHAVRSRGPASRWLPALCVAPFAFSGLVLGLGYILAFSRPPLRLYGTLPLLWLAYTARELGVSFKVIQASLSQLGPELEEAARMCGADTPYLTRRVLAPLLAPSLSAAGLLVFLASYREVESSVLLAGPGREVFGYQLFNGFQDGTWRQISALALLGAAICGATAACVRWATRQRGGANA